MLYNFKTVEDDQQWVVDTEKLTWARASSILATSSVKAAENNLARFVAAEEGLLAPFGGGAFRLVGRKPFVDGKPSLVIVAIIWVPVTDEDGAITMVGILQSNVDTKDAKPQDIKRFKMECLPAAKQAQNPAQRPIAQPPITVAERKAATPTEETPEIPLDKQTEKQ